MKAHEELVATAVRGRHVIWVCPPDAAYGQPIWDASARRLSSGGSEGVRALVLAGDRRGAGAIARRAGGCVVAGLARGRRMLAGEPPAVLVVTPEDALALCQVSALKFDRLDHVIVAWPEMAIAAHQSTVYDQLFAEARDVPRLILAWNLEHLSSFTERHAHRALVFNRPESPPPPVGRLVRYHVVGPEGREAAATAVLETQDPAGHALWNPGDPVPGPPLDLILCRHIPAGVDLARLADVAPVTVLVTASQLPYLQSIAVQLRALRVAAAAEQARTRAAEVRARIAQAIETSSLDGDLHALDPLFERFDPALVAAALLNLSRSEPAGSGAEAPAEPRGWVKVFLNLGKRDRVRPGDIVGALVNEVGIGRRDVGRIDLRDTHAVVELAAEVAGRAIEQLGGVTIRNRRVTARRDVKQA